MNRRFFTAVLLALLVLAGTVVDRLVDVPGDRVPPSRITASEFPVAARDGAPSVTWFCAGGTADEERFADHTVVAANVGDEAIEVSITVFAGSVLPPIEDAALDELDPEDEQAQTTTTTVEADDAGETGEAPVSPTAAVDREPIVRVLEVPAHDRAVLRLGDVVEAPIASALVEADSSALIVDHEVTSIHGHDAKPCTTGASDRWHFAWGTTEREARELLVLFNPFAGDAIVDARFSTDDGAREPARLDGLVIPGRSTVAIDLGDDVTRRAEVAGTITATTGRIVADRIVRLAETEGDRGLTVQSGVPAPQRAWVFPQGFASDAWTETYFVYNPSDAVAEVEVSVALDDPATNGVPEPVELTVAPGGHVRLDVTDQVLPIGVGHSAVVRSANATPVVAERVLSSRGPDQRGISVTTGSPVEATEWTLASGEVGPTDDEWLIVANLDPEVLSELDVSLVVDGREQPVTELASSVVEAGSRLAIRLSAYVDEVAATVVVRSSEPVVVERVWFKVGEERGLSHAVGVPSPQGLRLPQDPLQVTVEADLGDLETDGDDVVPTAPDDVELPDPDETIVIDDPDAEVPGAESTTTAAPSSSSSAG